MTLSRFAWVSTQPFGGPVVPDVYTIVAGSSGATATTTASPRRAPIARSSASVIAPSTAPSITMTCSSAGSASRTCAIFAAWSASSTNATRVSEWPSTCSHSSGEFVW